MPSVAVIRPARPEEYAAVGELTVRAYAADGSGGPAYAERLRDAAGRAAAGLLLVATAAADHSAAEREATNCGGGGDAGDRTSGSGVAASTPQSAPQMGVQAALPDPLPEPAAQGEGAGQGSAAGHGERLTGSDGLLGTAALFAAGSAYAQLAGPGETEIRMLAVDPAARGRGVGAALAAACVQLSAEAGAVGIRLSTEDGMTAAHRIYERLGFRRTPERDWSPVPGETLLTYGLHLTETPAYCDHCGRPLDAGEHAGCAAARRLEPPRYCRRCVRRLVVQVTPLGWSARCARHGERSGDEPHLA